MTFLPPEIIQDIEEKSAPENWQHNWMYSFSPARLRGEIWIEKEESGYQDIIPINIYLVGFCKVCRKGFSAPIPLGSTYQEAVLQVPRWGCVEPRGI